MVRPSRVPGMEGIIDSFPSHALFFPHLEVNIASVFCPLHFLKWPLGLTGSIFALSVFGENIWFTVGAGFIAARFGYYLGTCMAP